MEQAQAQALTGRQRSPASTQGGYRRVLTGLPSPRVRVLGTEFAGEVEAVGPSVTSFAVGDRVFGFRGLPFGAHAEYLVIPEDGFLATMPAPLRFEEAAPSTERSEYALALIRKAKVASGQEVLVNGATGAIGSAAVYGTRGSGGWAAIWCICGSPRLSSGSRASSRSRACLTSRGRVWPP
jgi:D-arabinose 1-dehydrogenase-like Zn-dependent alcohol dehydrogenase